GRSRGKAGALAWPGAEIAVMGARGAVEILARRELAALPEGPERDARRARLEDEYAATHLSPEAALDRGYVDEVIDPAHTRPAVRGAPADAATHLSPEAALDRGYVDEVIDPADTRRAVAGALAALTTKRERLRPRRHENIPL